MEALNTALLRIVLRYLSGGLVILGLSPEIVTAVTGNPDLNALILTGIGLVTGAATEWVYAQARKDGRAL